MGCVRPERRQKEPGPLWCLLYSTTSTTLLWKEAGAAWAKKLHKKGLFCTLYPKDKPTGLGSFLLLTL